MSCRKSGHVTPSAACSPGSAVPNLATSQRQVLRLKRRTACAWPCQAWYTTRTWPKSSWRLVAESRPVDCARKRACCSQTLCQPTAICRNSSNSIAPERSWSTLRPISTTSSVGSAIPRLAQALPRPSTFRHPLRAASASEKATVASFRNTSIARNDEKLICRRPSPNRSINFWQVCSSKSLGTLIDGAKRLPTGSTDRLRPSRMACSCCRCIVAPPAAATAHSSM
mmetsp:Transcript_6278/g.18019  ORF Transcript_6278/g.18019 Transcript_6278/m.18019 type:complete len:226 (+) Transcript_6278:343-1020(+)